MKQTAVNYLVKEFSDILGVINTTPMQDLLMVDAINKAKATEKQQIIDAYVNGMSKGNELHTGEHKITLDVNHLPYSIDIAEQYISETFKDK